MVVNKAYKFRIYPNKEQEVLIAKTMGCSRFVFNYFLAKWNETYKATGKGLSYGACCSELPNLKKITLAKRSGQHRHSVVSKKSCRCLLTIFQETERCTTFQKQKE
ncbi:helix-turn-helix domain-containing protein [Aneurinibacillus sp. XH2]|uniref:helix-turn-helix domain-containing protein n=1 Tax=Aneurinibacillus sp. XH2 TaxID=1450761 RepID=UPI000B1B6478|nr:helix-turn-helix domain-containing protein [Aneurinibacillus sp. XH2]